MVALGVVALGVVAVRYRWGVVAFGVVAGKYTEINRAHKNPQHKIPLFKSNTNTKPPKFTVPSFRGILVYNLTIMV